jgi:hypothetical protein
LLIVVVVLVVLSIVGLVAGSCSGGGGNSGAERRQTLGDSFAKRLSDLVPRAAPVTLTTTTAPCLSGQQLQFTTSCVVQVPPTDEARRQLRLVVLGPTSVGVAVAQTVGGQTPDPTETTVPFSEDGKVTRDITVIVGRGDRATVSLVCKVISCVLDVNPPE